MYLLKKVAIFFVSFFAFFGIVFLSTTLAEFSQSSNYKIQADSINFSGPDSNSSNYKIIETSGEIATGNSSSTNFVTKAGFRQSGGFQCSDGIDNDGDSLVDYPNDPSCESLLDDDEADIAVGGGGGGPGTGGDEDSAELSCDLNISPSEIIVGESAIVSWVTNNFQTGGEIFPLVGPVVYTGSETVSPLHTTIFNAYFTIGTKQVNCSSTLIVKSEEQVSGSLSFIVSNILVPEDNGPLDVFIERLGGEWSILEANIIDVPGSAQNLADYILLNNSVSFADQESGQKLISIDIVNDDLFEGNETFALEIITDEPGKRSSPYFLNITIVDDDLEEEPASSVTFVKQVLGGDRLPVDFFFTIGGKTYQSGETISVLSDINYLVSENSVQDYLFFDISGSDSCPVSVPGVFNLSKGENIICVVQNIFQKLPPEIDEEDLNDPEVVLEDLFSTETDNLNVIESDQFVTVPIAPFFNNINDLKVKVFLIPGTALPGQDYTQADFFDELYWPAGNSDKKEVVIPIINDDVLEDLESFSLLFKTEDGRVIKTVNITIDDDDSCSGILCDVKKEINFNKVKETVSGLFLEGKTKDLLQGVATAGAVAGALSFASVIFSNPLSLGEIFLLPLRIWSLILTALGLRKRYRPWGVVYDSQTKQPLDPVYVSLLDEEGKEVASSLTDIDGRYGFLVKPGIYTLMVKKTHYEFPAKSLKNQNKDELYQDLYYGEKITIEKEGDVIAKNIPMDPLGFDWNEYAKNGMKVMRFHVKHALLIARITQVLFVIGFIVSTIAYLVVSKPYNTIIFALYLVMLAIRIIGLRTKKVGYVRSLNSKAPLSFAVVKIKSPKTGVQVARRICDQNGKYYALVGPGVYDLTIDQKLSDGTYKQVFSAKNIEAKKGIISQSFYVFGEK